MYYLQLIKHLGRGAGLVLQKYNAVNLWVVENSCQKRNLQMFICSTVGSDATAINSPFHVCSKCHSAFIIW